LIFGVSQNSFTELLGVPLSCVIRYFYLSLLDANYRANHRPTMMFFRFHKKISPYASNLVGRWLLPAETCCRRPSHNVGLL
jgi:hypothetical protein